MTLGLTIKLRGSQAWKRDRVLIIHNNEVDRKVMTHNFKEKGSLKSVLQMKEDLIEYLIILVIWANWVWVK